MNAVHGTPEGERAGLPPADTLASARDLEDRRRAEQARSLDESWQHALLQLDTIANQSVETITHFVLRTALELTSSRSGYIAFMSEDETSLTVRSCSKGSLEEGRDATPQTYGVAQPGPWNEAVRQRRPVVANAGVPPSGWTVVRSDGGAEVARDMNIPVVDGERIVALVGVADKETGYNESDVRRLTLLVGAMWRMVRRKQADDRLRQTTEALRRVQGYLAEEERLTHTGSWIFSVARNEYVHISEECSRIFELDLQQGAPTRETIARLIHPEDWGRVQRDFDESITAMADTSSEFRVVLPSGAITHVQATRHPVTNAGDVVEIVGTVIDITQRKRAEEEHRNHVRFLESLDRINRAVQGTNDLERMMSDVLDAVLEVFDADRAWLVHPCDPDAPAWRALMEHTRPRFPGAFALATDLPMSEEVAGIMRLALASRRPALFGPGHERQMPAGLAERFSIESAMMMALHPKGDAPYLFGIHQCFQPRLWTAQEQRLFEEIGHRLTDALTSLLMFRSLRESERRLDRELTRIREAESEVRAMETRFRACVDFAADALLLHKDDATIIDVNHQACEVLGYTRDELLGRTGLLFEADHDAAMFESVVERVRAGELVTFESHHRRKDGTVFPVEVRSRRFFQGGEMFGISVVRDITERKLVEAELRQALSALARRQRASMMGEVAAALAHEINQPIAACMIDATACLRALAPDRLSVDDARRAASRLVREATWADEIINRTRALYREGTSCRERVDVSGVIREMAVLFRRETPSEITIRTDLADGLPDAIADRVQLQQVLMNLLQNAIDAMKDTGGELTIASRVEDNGDLRVSVSDTGVGLPTHAAERIFDPFVTTKKQGTGMGLAISRTIVESHGGRLWASSNARAGATFHFTLPSASDAHLARPS